jgi:hypothetical protein
MFGFLRKKPQRQPFVHPELGRLEPGESGGWDARVMLDGAPITLSIDGGDRPDEEALARALTLFRNPTAFAEKVSSFLQHESASSQWRPPNAGLDHSHTIASLRIEAVLLGGDGGGMIYFESEDERVWRCDLEGGAPRDLGFDS